MFDYEERDELIACEMCAGNRVLHDLCGVSVCAWCDGTGMQEARIVTLLAPSPRPRVVESEDGTAVDMDAMPSVYPASLLRTALIGADFVRFCEPLPDGSAADQSD